MGIPLSLYIHFPWCIRKCPYCDFNSHALKNDLPEENYIKQLLLDLKKDLPRVKNRKIHSIFMGGGTPSLFSPKNIKQLLIDIQELIEFNNTIEITLEANPGTFEQEKFAGFRDAGINRLSIGIQSFQADKLKALGRIHDGEAALRAVEIAQKSGFDNFNLDLMHGLPNQTIEDALFDLKTALSFSPPHLSWYQLTLEPNTLFYKNPPPLPPEEIIEGINQEGETLLKNYHHYEVSAFCKPNRECQHNLNYWEFGDYLGIGAGAHGKIGKTRTVKHKHPKDYLNAENFILSEAEIKKSELVFEFMLNALRLRKEIPWDLVKERIGIIELNLQPLVDKNLMVVSKQGFKLTALGERFLNDVTATFL